MMEIRTLVGNLQGIANQNNSGRAHARHYSEQQQAKVFSKPQSSQQSHRHLRKTPQQLVNSVPSLQPLIMPSLHQHMTNSSWNLASAQNLNLNQDATYENRMEKIKTLDLAQMEDVLHSLESQNNMNCQQSDSQTVFINVRPQTTQHRKGNSTIIKELVLISGDDAPIISAGKVMYHVDGNNVESSILNNHQESLNQIDIRRMSSGGRASNIGLAQSIDIQEVMQRTLSLQNNCFLPNYKKNHMMKRQQDQLSQYIDYGHHNQIGNAHQKRIHALPSYLQQQKFKTTKKIGKARKVELTVTNENGHVVPVNLHRVIYQNREIANQSVDIQHSLVQEFDSKVIKIKTAAPMYDQKSIDDFATNSASNNTMIMLGSPLVHPHTIAAAFQDFKMAPQMQYNTGDGSPANGSQQLKAITLQANRIVVSTGNNNGLTQTPDQMQATIRQGIISANLAGLSPGQDACIDETVNNSSSHHNPYMNQQKFADSETFNILNQEGLSKYSAVEHVSRAPETDYLVQDGEIGETAQQLMQHSMASLGQPTFQVNSEANIIIQGGGSLRERNINSAIEQLPINLYLNEQETSQKQGDNMLKKHQQSQIINIELGHLTTGPMAWEVLKQGKFTERTNSVKRMHSSNDKSKLKHGHSVEKTQMGVQLKRGSTVGQKQELSKKPIQLNNEKDYVQIEGHLSKVSSNQTFSISQIPLQRQIYGNSVQLLEPFEISVDRAKHSLTKVEMKLISLPKTTDARTDQGKKRRNQQNVVKQTSIDRIDPVINTHRSNKSNYNDNQHQELISFGISVLNRDKFQKNGLKKVNSKRSISNAESRLGSGRRSKVHSSTSRKRKIQKEDNILEGQNSLLMQRAIRSSKELIKEIIKENLAEAQHTKDQRNTNTQNPLGGIFDSPGTQESNQAKVNFFENRYEPDEELYQPDVELEFGVNDIQSASHVRLLNEVMATNNKTNSDISPDIKMRPMLEGHNDFGQINDFSLIKPQLLTNDQGSKYLENYADHNGDIILNAPLQIGELTVHRQARRQITNKLVTKNITQDLDSNDGDQDVSQENNQQQVSLIDISDEIHDMYLNFSGKTHQNHQSDPNMMEAYNAQTMVSAELPERNVVPLKLYSMGDDMNTHKAICQKTLQQYIIAKRKQDNMSDFLGTYKGHQLRRQSVEDEKQKEIQQVARQKQQETSLIFVKGTNIKTIGQKFIDAANQLTTFQREERDNELVFDLIAQPGQQFVKDDSKVPNLLMSNYNNAQKNSGNKIPTVIVKLSEGSQTMLGGSMLDHQSSMGRINLLNAAMNKSPAKTNSNQRYILTVSEEKPKIMINQTSRVDIISPINNALLFSDYGNNADLSPNSKSIQSKRGMGGRSDSHQFILRNDQVVVDVPPSLLRTSRDQKINNQLVSESDRMVKRISFNRCGDNSSINHDYINQRGSAEIDHLTGDSLRDVSRDQVVILQARHLKSSQKVEPQLELIVQAVQVQQEVKIIPIKLNEKQSLAKSYSKMMQSIGQDLKNIIPFPKNTKDFQSQTMLSNSTSVAVAPPKVIRPVSQSPHKENIGMKVIISTNSPMDSALQRERRDSALQRERQNKVEGYNHTKSVGRLNEAVIQFQEDQSEVLYKKSMEETQKQHKYGATWSQWPQITSVGVSVDENRHVMTRQQTAQAQARTNMVIDQLSNGGGTRIFIGANRKEKYSQRISGKPSAEILMHSMQNTRKNITQRPNTGGQSSHFASQSFPNIHVTAGLEGIKGSMVSDSLNTACYNGVFSAQNFELLVPESDCIVRVSQSQHGVHGYNRQSQTGHVSPKRQSHCRSNTYHVQSQSLASSNAYQLKHITQQPMFVTKPAVNKLKVFQRLKKGVVFKDEDFQAKKPTAKSGVKVISMY